jgi:hypothetical protein
VADTLDEFVRARAPGPFERELARLRRIEELAKRFIELYEVPLYIDDVMGTKRNPESDWIAVGQALAELAKAVR